MDLKSPTPSGDDVLLFADCGVNPNPNAQELVDIALATSATLPFAARRPAEGRIPVVLDQGQRRP